PASPARGAVRRRRQGRGGHHHRRHAPDARRRPHPAGLHARPGRRRRLLRRGGAAAAPRHRPRHPRRGAHPAAAGRGLRPGPPRPRRGGVMEALNAVVEWFTLPLQFDFMWRAMLVSVVAGAVCAVLSCWMTLIGWSLMGDAVSHAVLPGVVLSYLLGLPFAVGALVFGAGSVALIGVVN